MHVVSFFLIYPRDMMKRAGLFLTEPVSAAQYRVVCIGSRG